MRNKNSVVNIWPRAVIKIVRGNVHVRCNFSLSPPVSVLFLLTMFTFSA